MANMVFGEVGMIVIGPENDICDFYKSLVKIFNLCNIKVMHYKEIDKKKIRTVSKGLADLINNSRRISFTIFEHRKPYGHQEKRYYLDFIPERISNHLKTLDNKNRLIFIDVHEDYVVSGVPNCTKVFMKSLIEKLSKKINRENTGIKIISSTKNGLDVSKIFSKNGHFIKIKIGSFTKDSSKAVNIADMSLGFYREYKNLVDKKINFIEI